MGDPVLRQLGCEFFRNIWFTQSGRELNWAKAKLQSMFAFDEEFSILEKRAEQ
jgi:hypothetical protein